MKINRYNLIVLIFLFCFGTFVVVCGRKMSNFVEQGHTKLSYSYSYCNVKYT